MEEFDYIVVGAGSAGCVLANRLSADPKNRVLVLEAGGNDNWIWFHIPVGYLYAMGNPRADWLFQTEQEPGLNGRALNYPRGKVIGGSSSINAMTYSRGHRGDYDRWAANGLPTWSYAHALPYFKKQETWEGGASAHRGGDGPLSTVWSTFTDPLADAFTEASIAAGVPWNDDLNSSLNDGVGRNQNTIRNGKRCSAAVAYLRPALSRKNLTVEVNATVAKIVLQGGRATGVEYRYDGQKTVANASREVILCGGVINSPQVLMLSGIGDPDELKQHGIKSQVALKGVGKNLQDHVTVMCGYSRKGPQGTIHRAMRADRIVLELMKDWFVGSGAANDIPGGMAAFTRVMSDSKVPDTQLLLAGAPLTAGPYFKPFKEPYQDAFGGRIIMLHPESRGTVSLASANPGALARIKQNFMSTDREWTVVRAALRKMQDIMSQPAMAPFIGKPIAPVSAKSSDTELDEHIRNTAITLHHPLGTCKMGPDNDETAVVDSVCCVRGVDNLRVVDASVMPDLISGNINAPVMMIAEKAADLIRGRPTLAPLNV